MHAKNSEMPKKNRFPIVMLILATIIWGSTFAVVKDTMNSVNEYYLIFMRSIIAALPLLALTLFKNPKSLFNKEIIKKGAIIGVALGLSYGFQNLGMIYTSAGNSAFIMASNVIFVPIFLVLFYKNRLNGKSIISILIVVFGLGLLTYKDGTELNPGDFLTLMSAAITALHIIWTGRFVKNSDLLALVTYQFLFAALLAFVASIFMSPESFTANYSPESWTAMIYLGLLGSLFCYFITVWAQKYVDYVTVTLIFSLEPVFAAVFSFYFIGEILGHQQLFGASLILFGILFFEIPFDRVINRSNEKL
jgi:drug/metabolite transporter (DMT)-like permease